MKKCLIVVDYQNDFVCGSLGFAAAAQLDGRIAAKIKQYHDNGDTVLFTFDTHTASYLCSQEGQHLPVPHCVEGTDGHRLYGETGRSRGAADLCFYKMTFGSDALYQHLRETPYAHIELVGLVTNICVISNAVLAKTAQPETPISVDAACTASNENALHQAALAVMDSLQMTITNSEDRR